MSKLQSAYRQTQPVRVPATKAELLQRLRDRPKPSSEMHLRPDGRDTTETDQRVAHANDVRIAQLRESLDTVHERLERSMSFAAIEGRARADFERNR